MSSGRGGRSRNDIANRRAHGFDSTAAFTHAEGQKHLSTLQQRRLDRLREGKCPECGGEVSEEVRLGKVLVNGRAVNKCDACRQRFQRYAELRKQRATGAPLPAAEEGQDMATLLGERLNQASEIDKAKERFAAVKDSKILVVGVRTNNLQREARGHQRIIVWDPTDRFNGQPHLPTNVSVVLCTRVCSHAYSQGLRKQAGERNAFMFSGLITSGEVRKHLADILSLDKTKTHDDTSDDLGEVELPNNKPLPPLPRLAAAKPAPAPVQKPPAEAPMVHTTGAPIFTNPDPDVVMDDVIDMMGQGIAAMQLAREQLVNAKAALAAAREKQLQLDTENASAKEKLDQLRILLKGI